jgi:hypothetical protein
MPVSAGAAEDVPQKVLYELFNSGSEVVARSGALDPGTVVGPGIELIVSVSAGDADDLWIGRRGNVELARLELGGLVPVVEGKRRKCCAW